ncbi:MAG: ribosome biogenesis GTPase YlqF, partial [Oscillospiraceae bacterium]|nr:ribosome biogenesis GTPase YlqF [Oscillospiraceae bacterium]
TKRQITEDLKLIDVVIEILDSRMPLSSQNPDIAKIIENKKRIIVLNKSDLAEESENNKWIEYFKSRDEIAITTDSNSGKGIKETLKQIERIMQPDMEKAALKGINQKRIRLMIIGIPNVGKSSFINRMCNKRSAEVGNKPGVTKQKQWVKVSNNIELLDTPGVLWPKFEDEEVALKLAYTGTIKDDVIIKVDVAYSLLKYLYENYKTKLFERYKITEENLENMVEMDSEVEYEVDKIYSLMKLIAKKRGALLSGGNLDDEKIAGIILNEFRSRMIGRITLEKLEAIKKETHE